MDFILFKMCTVKVIGSLEEKQRQKTGRKGSSLAVAGRAATGVLADAKFEDGYW